MWNSKWEYENQAYLKDRYEKKMSGELSATPLADDLSDRMVRNFARHLFLIAFFQIRLIFVFPFAVPHKISSFHDNFLIRL